MARMKHLCTLALSFLLLAGCGKDDKPGDKAGDKAGDDKAAPAAGGGGGGAKKGGTPMDPAEIKAITVPGYKITFMEGGMKSAASGGFEAEDGSSQGSVFAAPCEMCQPLDEKVWEGNRDNLMSMLSTSMKEDPSTIFEIAKKTYAGHEVMTTYSVGWQKHEGGSSSTHSLTVFWNDGTDNLMLRITPPFGGAPAESVEDFKAKADRAPLDRAAEVLVGAYVPALAK